MVMVLLLAALYGERSASSQTTADLVLSEIMYNPQGEDDTDGDEFEFVELKNTGSGTIDLAGVAFTAGIDFTFAAGTTLDPGALLVLASNPSAFEARYGFAPVGTYTGRLDNGGERLTLSDAAGATLASLRYNDKYPWPQGPDGDGFSLTLRDPSTQPDPSQADNWRPSSQQGGSPGADEGGFPSISPILVNEVLTHTDFPQKDAIELYNPTSEAVDISGWLLTDDRGLPAKFTIPANTLLPAGGYLVFDEADFNANPSDASSFGFSALGEEAYLFSTYADGSLSGHVHGFPFGAAENGRSFGRLLTTENAERFPTQREVSLGSENRGPLVGPVVLSELMYHPIDGDEEFIELVNISNENVPLFDPQHPENTWQIDGVAYAFPSNVEISPGEVVLVVPTDPAAFRSKYGLSNQVRIFGPYTGKLDNAGETIRLSKPDPPSDDGTVPMVLVDAVSYNDSPPWPVTADGEGRSLARIDIDVYGNDPANWSSSLVLGGSPGAGNPVNVESPIAEVSAAPTLEPAYPNPFRITATLHFAVPTTQQVRVTLHDLLGREVQVLYEGTVPAQSQQTLQVEGAPLPSGLYYVRMETATHTSSRSIVLTK